MPIWTCASPSGVKCPRYRVSLAIDNIYSSFICHLSGLPFFRSQPDLLQGSIVVFSISPLNLSISSRHWWVLWPPSLRHPFCDFSVTFSFVIKKVAGILTVWTFPFSISSMEISNFTSVKDCRGATLGTICAVKQSHTQRHGCEIEKFWKTTAYHRGVIRISIGLRCVHLIKQIGVVISSDQYEQHHHKTNTCPSRPPQTASGQTAALANQLSENQRGQQD